MRLTAKRAWLKEARKFFRDITSEFQIEKKHYATFYGTCENLNDFYSAKELIKNQGMTFETQTGQIRKNPACQIQKDSWSAFLQGLKVLGLHGYQNKVGRPGGK